ncbi:cytochrome P450 [Actinocorallia aurantiaca]|uniref:Cytochrome P450 n=1 Tax=Actinocorallia aurantiaca TaxID=46204 RepID=A0ABN3TTM7_9ACTN
MSSNLEYSPYDYRIHEDPYPVYARLRREAPLYRNEELDFWALSRHADVAGAFREWERFSSINGVTLDASAWGPWAHRTMSFLALDPPRHTRLRGLVSKGFTPRRVRELHPRILEMTRELLEPLVEEGSFDFVADFAGVLPMDVISELMGVPEADRPELRRLADVVVHREEDVQDVPPAGMDAALTLVGYYEELLAAKRRKPGDDLTSALLEAELDGDRLADREIIAFLFLMVIAGNETTTKLLANALYWAWRHGFVERSLKEPVDGWIEETLRYDTSSQQLARTVTEDFTVHGRTVPAGSRLLLLVGSANRDEDVFPDPDRYDLGRDTSQLISFGAGRHYCLGANMARLEARIALDELARLASSYDVDGGRAVRVHSSNVRGFSTLPVSVIPRSRGRAGGDVR